MQKMPSSLIRFEAFLREAENRAETRKGLTLIGFVGFLTFFGIAVLIARFLIVPSSIIRIAGILLLSGMVNSKITESLHKSRKAKLLRQDPLHETYKALIKELKKYSENRTLGERLHPAVARQLESVADSFFRVRTWLKTPSSKNVLGDSLHTEVVQATDRAMREVIFSIHGAYRPSGMQRKQWDKMVKSDPDALDACDSLSRINGLLGQLTDIMGKVESFGVTITLTDQLRAISDAIEEMEQSTFAHIKSLPASAMSHQGEREEMANR
jgi:hypothetical protein